ncbi:flavodoxin [Pelosinus baikalensis]|uniref:NAD(P)H-dependent oxidoreductase n=1 Tax=Pelosinus baikalensis TaxID=2892015 RepID=A0ABS8HPL0_9FIRM|nr:flavodoxin [Pelosinus baikalensis]MCC5465126.1 NAD(P)H-dependent oxidoreductase [Pelosinus baikalensis]MCC5465259.1 NAD(P)H-dependent oxidoreductase [Pelosinus baikalensis]
MKKMLALALTLIMALSLTACSGNNSGVQAGNGPNVAAQEKTSPLNTKTESGDQKQMDSTRKKILIAYFSRTSNTREIANQIHENVGGDLFEIVTVNPYPADYNGTVDQAKREQENNSRPKLTAEVKNMDSYDVVFVGYPNWWGTMPMAVFTFWEGYNFSGKTIIPFSTHEGSGLGRSVNDIRALCPQATILDGLAIRGSDAKNARNDVSAWLRKLGMIN